MKSVKIAEKNIKQKRKNTDTAPPEPLPLAMKSELERKNPLSRQDLEDKMLYT